MAANKKTPPKKPATKKSTQNSSGRKRQASRPPTIELKADEVVDKSRAKPKETKSSKVSSNGTSKHESVKERDGENKTKFSPEKTPPGKNKTPLIAAALAGLLAGTAGGIVAGLILTNSTSEDGTDQNLALLQEKVQKIESGQQKSKSSSQLLTRLQKAEGDYRFLNIQLSTLQKDISKLKEQLAAFSSGLSTSTEGVSAPRVPSIDISGLEAKITSLQNQIEERTKKISELSSRLQALQNELDRQSTAQNEDREKTKASVQKTTQDYAKLQKSVDEKISKLYQAGGDNRIRAAALSLSLRQLSDAVRSSAPFSRELKAVGALLGESHIIDNMKPYADKGVPNLAGLKASFSQIKIERTQPKKEPVEGTLIDKIVTNAKSVVRIKKVGEEPDAPKNPLTSLKRKLWDGDLPGVAELYEKLGPQIKEKYKPWFGEVEKRLVLNGMFAELQNIILTEIGHSTGQAKLTPKKADDSKTPEAGSAPAEVSSETHKPAKSEDAQ